MHQSIPFISSSKPIRTKLDGACSFLFLRLSLNRPCKVEGVKSVGGHVDNWKRNLGLVLRFDSDTDTGVLDRGGTMYIGLPLPRQDRAAFPVCVSNNLPGNFDAMGRRSGGAFNIFHLLGSNCSSFYLHFFLGSTKGNRYEWNHWD